MAYVVLRWAGFLTTCVHRFKPDLETIVPAAKKSTATDASANITQRIRDLGDWRGEILARIRELVHEVDPSVHEDWKWRGVPTWEHDGILCTGESYKQVVKLTFARGAVLPDPKKIFNSSLEGNVRRAIDIREGETFNETAFKQLIKAAIAANVAAVAERKVKRNPPE